MENCSCYLPAFGSLQQEVSSSLKLVQLINESTRPNLKNASKSTLIYFYNRSERTIASGVFNLGVSGNCLIACVRNKYLRIPNTPSQRSARIEQAFLNDSYDGDIHLMSGIPHIELAFFFYNILKQTENVFYDRPRRSIASANTLVVNDIESIVLPFSWTSPRHLTG